MEHDDNDDQDGSGRGPSRRTVLMAGAGALATAALAACSRGSETAGSGGTTASTASPTPTTGAATAAPGATTLAPTPECVDADDVTPAQTEGPYFKPNSPQRSDLRAGVAGTRLLLSGTVVTTACRPVARALVDLWQADGEGVYDNSGFRLRGHVFTDDQGRYRFDTVMPGLYPGRTRHLHVKAQAPNGRVLTTQLYFPGEAQNARDGIFREECMMTLADAADGKTGTFTFVLSG